jgi:GDP-4-dehydro-6-deoxy-D-mannose reductase
MTTPDRPVLVTGAAGFAGSHLLDLLEASSRDVVAWRRPGEALPAPPTGAHASWMEVDLLDRGSVRRAIEAARPGLVYHLAGIAHVGGSWDLTYRTFAVNVLGTYHLLMAVATLDPPPRVLVTGSAHVYKDHDRAIAESDAIGPGSPYGLSKLAQEMTGADAAANLGVPVLLTRPFNHIGPRQDASFFTAGVARQVARIEGGLLEPVIEVGNLDGRRDLTDVRDTVRAYRAIAERGTPGRVYNVCTGQAHRIGDILEMMLGSARVKIEVRRDPARYRPHDSPLVLGDRSRLTTELGWAPAIPMAQTLADLLAFWRQAEAGPAPSARID